MTAGQNQRLVTARRGTVLVLGGFWWVRRCVHARRIITGLMRVCSAMGLFTRRQLLPLALMGALMAAPGEGHNSRYAPGR